MFSAYAVRRFISYSFVMSILAVAAFSLLILVLEEGFLLPGQTLLPLCTTLPQMGVTTLPARKELPSGRSRKQRAWSVPVILSSSGPGVTQGFS